MILAADVAAKALFQATDHDVIQRVRVGVETIASNKKHWACNLPAFY